MKSADPFVAEAAGHLVEAGGKRFRPLLVLLAAQLRRPDAPGVVPAAVVVELTHLATLYHDDVMDEAPLRRGAPSANARWDNTIAILTGDFLFARASDLLADLGPQAVRIQARTFERLVTGQIRETVGPAEGQDPLDHYLAVLADKTGSLIATSGRFGAMLSGADEQTVDVLTRFGERIGVAFQLADDLLDVAQRRGRVRQDARHRPARGRRRRCRCSTRCARRDPADARLRDLLSRPLHDDAEHAEALALLRRTRRWSPRAPRCCAGPTTPARVLAPLPDVPAREALERLCDAVVDRSS